MNTRSREAGRGSTVRSASTLLEKVEYVEQKEDFYATVNEEQMLKNSTFPGSTNGTGLFQTIVGLKIREVYERITETTVAPVSASA